MLSRLVVVDRNAGTFTLTLASQGSSTATLTVTDVDTFEITGLDFGSIAYKGATFVRDGLSYYGVLEAENAPSVSEADRFLKIVLSGVPDGDGDSFPDLTDPDVEKAGLSVVNNDWSDTAPLGWIFSFENGWTYSLGLDFTFYRETFPWMYSPLWGWFYWGNRSDGFVWFYYPAGNDWFAAQEGIGGWFWFRLLNSRSGEKPKRNGIGV